MTPCYLKQGLNIADDAKDAWYRHWIMLGFEAFENSLVKANLKGPYCLGAEVTLADLCLVPQMYNAHRFDVPLEAYPALCAIEQACLELDAFKQASPEKQIDAT